jgi:hypothetical protein
MKQLTGKRTIISSCYKKLSNLETIKIFGGILDIIINAYTSAISIAETPRAHTST